MARDDDEPDYDDDLSDEDDEEGGPEIGTSIEIVAIGRPVVIGTSRKTFIGKITGRPPAERVAGTIATNVIALERGASIFRVHDVREAVDALAVAASTLTGQWTTSPTA